MAKQSKGKRSPKKELMRRFEREFDLHRLNYPARVKMVRPKSMLIGFITAGGLYSIGFGLSYAAMASNNLPLESFAKMVWMMMIPTTIAGFFAWQLSKNRMEYPIRVDITSYISELEAKKGLLWRFSPLIDLFDDTPLEVKKALSWSQEGRTDKLDVEEYTDSLFSLLNVFRDNEDSPKLPELTAKVNANFSGSEQEHPA